MNIYDCGDIVDGQLNAYDPRKDLEWIRDTIAPTKAELLDIDDLEIGEMFFIALTDMDFIFIRRVA